jgi:hypothetical protein
VVIDAKNAILGELHLGLQIKKVSAVIFRKGNLLMKTLTKGMDSSVLSWSVARPEHALLLSVALIDSPYNLRKQVISQEIRDLSLPHGEPINATLSKFYSR